MKRALRAVKEVLSQAFTQMSEDRVGTMAAALAYFTFFSGVLWMRRGLVAHVMQPGALISTFERSRPMTERPKLTNISTLRERARRHIEEGAVVAEYKADRAMVIKLLDEALATEIVCSLRYKRHYYTAHGLASLSVAQEFLEHAREEEQHAERFAARISELGGAPNFSPHGLAERSHAEYVEGNSLMDMIREDLVAERIAIESYREIITYLGDDDPTTRRLFEDVLAVEEEHAEDLASLTSRLGKEEGGKPTTNSNEVQG